MKLEKLEKKLKKLGKEKSKLDQNRRYHKRQAEDTKRAKSFAKHDTMEKFYIKEIFRVDQEIAIIKGQIAELQIKKKEKEYLEKLKAFDEAMMGKLAPISSGLDIFVKELFLCDLSSMIEDAYGYYVKNSIGLSKKDLQPYINLDFRSIRIRATNIAEKYADARRFQSTRGDAVFRGVVKNKPVTWARQLSNQIKDVCRAIAIRSNIKHSTFNPGLVDKLKSKLNGD